MSWFSSPIFSLSLFLFSLVWLFFLSLSLYLCFVLPLQRQHTYPHSHPHTLHFIEPIPAFIIRRIIAYRIDYASRRLSSWNYCLCETKRLSMVAGQSKFSHGCVFGVRKKDSCLLSTCFFPLSSSHTHTLYSPLERIVAVNLF